MNRSFRAKFRRILPSQETWDRLFNKSEPQFPHQGNPHISLGEFGEDKLEMYVIRGGTARDRVSVHPCHGWCFSYYYCFILQSLGIHRANPPCINGCFSLSAQTGGKQASPINPHGASCLPVQEELSY